MTQTSYHADMISELPLVHQGKVRDSFAIGDDLLLIVASDRLSAFDVVLPDPIPGKGVILTQLSEFWFGRTGRIIVNHGSGLTPNDVIQDPTAREAIRDRAVVVKRLEPLPLEAIVRGYQLTELGVADVVKNPDLQEQLAGRALVVKRLKPLPVEAVVRGYLIGTGWNDYRQTGTVSGIALPPGLQQAAQLPEIIYTPSSKAAAGQHDENIDFAATERLVGRGLAAQVRDASIALYRFAAEHARSRGIIIADTKFEFGLDRDGRLHLMDEILTPDSSRFWPAAEYRVGISPPSFDKQFVRDYLETLDWDKTPPGPRLPPEIINDLTPGEEP